MWCFGRARWCGKAIHHLGEKLSNDVELGGDLAPANDGREGLLGVGQQEGKLVQLVDERKARSRQGREQLGHADGTRVCAMTDGEAVVDVHRGTGAVHQRLGERGVVLLLLSVESDILGRWKGGRGGVEGRWR